MLKFLERLFFRKIKKEFILNDGVIYYYTEKNTKDFYIDYLYDFILELDISLDNVFIHDKNSNGSLLKINKPHYVKSHNINRYLNKGIYFVLPELNNQLDDTIFHNRIDTWLHEIGHYIHNHFDCDKPLYIQEYEACNYAHHQSNRLPIPVKTFNKHISIYDKKILNAYIEYNLSLAQMYVKKHLYKYNPANVDISVESFLNIKSL